MVSARTSKTSRCLIARGIRAVARTVARLPRRDGGLDLAHPAALRPVEPGLLGLSRRHAGELAHRRPGELAGGEGGVEQAELGEGAADAEALLGLAPVQAEHALGILARLA